MKIFNEHMTAQMEGDFVVFLIGMRINRPWKFWKWLPVSRAMPKMIKELMEDGQRGFLSGQFWLGRTIISVQYWKSAEDLMAYARDKDSAHLPAWREFNRQIGNSGDVGIWHETYVVKQGAYEAIYMNMPVFGLAQAGGHIAARGAKRYARGRLGQSPEGDIA